MVMMVVVVASTVVVVVVVLVVTMTSLTFQKSHRAQGPIMWHPNQIPPNEDGGRMMT